MLAKLSTNMFYYQVNSNVIISSSRDYNVRIFLRWVNVFLKTRLHELVILQVTNNLVVKKKALRS